MKSHRLKAYIYLLIVAAIWGAAGPIIKYTLQGISPLPFLAYRFAISAIFSILFFIFFGIKFPKPKENLPLVLIYGLMAFPIALGVLFFGLEKTTVLDMTLISLLAPLLVAIGGVVFFKEHVTNREKTGIAIVVSGAIFTAISPTIMNYQVLRLSGNLLIILFLFADSIAVLIAKQVARKNVPSLTLINIGFIVGAITVIPLTIFLYGYTETINSIINLPLKYHLGVWYMALLSGTLAYFLYILAQKSIEVSEAALFRYLLPLFSIPLAVFWLGEKISIYFVIGAVLIIIGIIIAEYKKRR